MKKLITVLFFALFTIGYVSAQEKNVIVVSTSADTLVTPNLIKLQVVIQSDKGAGKKGLDIAQDRLFKVLSNAGIDTKKDVFIVDFTSSYKGNNILLYRTYQVNAKNMDQVDVIMLEAEQKGIANVDITKLENTDFENIQNILRAKALKKAKERAEFMVNVLGQKVGPAVYIAERYATSRQESVQFLRASSKANDSFAAPMNVDVQKINIAVSVEVQFKLSELTPIKPIKPI